MYISFCLESLNLNFHDFFSSLNTKVVSKAELLQVGIVFLIHLYA